LIHGEPLVACAAWALGEAGVTLVDAGTPWSSLAAAGLPVVLHDPLCPLTPPGFIEECVDACLSAASRAGPDGTAVVGVRPVTDSVKVVVDGRLGANIDREALLQIAAPVVLSPALVAGLGDLPTSDLVALVAALADHIPVLTREAPTSARRVADAEDLRLLEALTAGPRR
jgi:2-C-methyl-D-erythritol 4-phosphate cytidylyltransferase